MSYGMFLSYLEYWNIADPVRRAHHGRSYGNNGPFLTDGGRAQPIAVFLHASTGEVFGTWGARPAYIQNVMDEFKRNHPDKQALSYQEQLDQTYKKIGELYHDGNEYQRVMIQEIRQLLASFITDRITDNNL